ncbi:MAG: Dabb family protein [Oscillospiraceae bacterium]|nr:Dabb family protein [Oscillospiraceae bacterium]
MVKHIVMWKFKDFAEGKNKKENIEYIKFRLENLAGIIKEIKFIEVGENINSDLNYDAILYSEFESSEDLEFYQNHPEHKKISEYVGKVREGRVVGDYIV